MSELLKGCLKARCAKVSTRQHCAICEGPISIHEYSIIFDARRAEDDYEPGVKIVCEECTDLIGDVI